MTFARMPFSEIETHSRTRKIKVEWSEGPGKVDQKQSERKRTFFDSSAHLQNNKAESSNLRTFKCPTLFDLFHEPVHS